MNNEDASQCTPLQSAFQNSYAKIENCVKERPHSALMISIGAGLGLGVLTGLVLGGNRQSTSHGWIDRRTAEQFGQRMMAKMGEWVPDSISDRINR